MKSSNAIIILRLSSFYENLQFNLKRSQSVFLIPGNPHDIINI